MPEQGKWRISTAYDYIEELDAPDLAWEFLRRNPEYRLDYERLHGASFDESKVDAALSNKWGLSFRSGPQSRSKRCMPRLDTPGRSVDADPADIPSVAHDCTR